MKYRHIELLGNMYTCLTKIDDETSNNRTLPLTTNISFIQIRKCPTQFDFDRFVYAYSVTTADGRIDKYSKFPNCSDLT